MTNAGFATVFWAGRPAEGQEGSPQGISARAEILNPLHLLRCREHPHPANARRSVLVKTGGDGEPVAVLSCRSKPGTFRSVARLCVCVVLVVVLVCMAHMLLSQARADVGVAMDDCLADAQMLLGRRG